MAFAYGQRYNSDRKSYTHSCCSWKVTYSGTFKMPIGATIWKVETYRNKFKNRSVLRTIGSSFFSIFWFYKKGKRIEIFMSQFFGDKRWSPFICCDPCRSQKKARSMSFHPNYICLVYHDLITISFKKDRIWIKGHGQDK